MTGNKEIKMHSLLNRHRPILKHLSLESINTELDGLFGVGGWSLEYENRPPRLGDVPFSKTEDFEGLCYIRLEDDTIMKMMYNYIDDADQFRSEFNSKFNHKQYPDQFTNIKSHLISGADTWNDIPYTSNIIHRSSNIIIMEYFADYQPLSIMDLTSNNVQHTVKLRSLLGQPFTDNDVIIESAKNSSTYKDIISQLLNGARGSSFEDHEIYDRHIDADHVMIPYVRPFSKEKLMTVIPEFGNIVSLYDTSSIIVKKDADSNIVDWKYCELDLIVQPMFTL